MRNNTLALACLLAGSFAPQFAAHAQGVTATTAAGNAAGSVTLFGVVDVAVTQGNGSVSDKLALTSGNSSTSRLGLRGTEGLGGGMYAGFWLEGRLNADDGTGAASNANNQPATGPSNPPNTQGFMFDRGAYVTLGGGWGEVRLGRDFNATYRNRVDFDPFGNVGVGNSLPNSMSIAGVTSTRASNMINYLTPTTLGGFFGAVNYFLGENNSGGATEKDGTGFSLRGGYAGGPWFAGASYGVVKYSTGDIKVVNAGVSYAFPWAKLMGAVYRDTVEAAAERTGKSWILAASVPLGPHEVKASVSRYEIDTAGVAGTAKTTKFAIGDVYSLSKRTALYATYAHVNNSGGATHAVGGGVTAANENASGFDVGIRHSF